jgi:hypothetical protein
MFFSCIGAALLLGSVCRSLLSKVLLLEVQSRNPSMTEFPLFRTCAPVIARCQSIA